MEVNSRWPNQEEAYNFALKHPSCMLDMDMGTGKTRTALDVAFARSDVNKILIVCPKAVLKVWEENLHKFHSGEGWSCLTLDEKLTVKKKAEKLKEWEKHVYSKAFVVVNYDSVWRSDLGEFIYKKAGFDLVILDESHRAKSAGSKVSKYLGMVGKTVKYKMCLSGTPMSNSPLDVYGQYRFLDNTIFGTNYGKFLQKYAVLGGPNGNWIMGYQNQQDLISKFKSIAYSCKMSDIADRLKLPETLPVTEIGVELSSKDMKALKDLNKDFVAECGSGNVVVSSVLVKLLRLRQICSGFCFTQENPYADAIEEEINTSKEDALFDTLQDISLSDPVVVFCVFKHDLDATHRAAKKAGRRSFELSGRYNNLDEWKKDSSGSVIAVQIQAGAEGVDMTRSNHAIYFNAPLSLALYNQSRARLYRPGQSRPVNFRHIVARGTVDESIYNSLSKKQDIVESIKNGTFDFGFVK